MFKTLVEEFKRFIGQPVRVFTDDEKETTGRVLTVFEDAVRLIDKCQRIVLIEFRHIDKVVEPQMELEECCREEERKCRHHEHHEECEECGEEPEGLMY